jgi:hypothetical protein
VNGAEAKEVHKLVFVGRSIHALAAQRFIPVFLGQGIHALAYVFKNLPKYRALRELLVKLVYLRGAGGQRFAFVAAFSLP